MDLKEFAKWIVNVDGTGATDEEFAEFFVRLYKWFRTEGTDDTIEGKDMLEAPIDEMCDWIKACLKEIILDEDVVSDAWWKK